MLTHLHLRDFVLIEEAALEFGSGMTVLTGETGAGKSILIDALALLLGARADPGVVRRGARQAEITAVFDIARQPAVRAALAAQGGEGGDECILRRVIRADGRSRALLDGAPAPLASLRRIGALLVEIHSQHEHHALLSGGAQRRLLDDCAGNASLRAETALRHRQWERLCAERARMARRETERDARLDLLEHQLGELEAFGPAAGEYAALEREQARLADADRLCMRAHEALARLRGGEGDNAPHTLGLLHRALEAAEELRALDPRLDATCELLRGAAAQSEEAAIDLRDYLERMESDPERLQTVDERLAACHALARKHRVEAEALPALFERLAAEREALQKEGSRLRELDGAIAAGERSYRAAAERLSANRRAAAARLADAVAGNLDALGMAGGGFRIELHPLAPERIGPNGLEQVEFLVRTNPGQPFHPLAKSASGGELSRVSLAIHTAGNDNRKDEGEGEGEGENGGGRDGVATLIFDEVDAGVGGAAAAAVGERLRALGASRQALCITHLPQVAAQAQRHFRVDKRAENGAVVSRIAPLDAAQRVEEIARMLGGAQITAKSRAHARELLAS